MSDVMLFGALRMPIDLAMDNELSRRQFYQRAQQAADELVAARAERDAAQCELAAYKQAVYEAVSDDVAATGELTPSVYGKGWITCAEFIDRRARELLAANSQGNRRA